MAVDSGSLPLSGAIDPSAASVGALNNMAGAGGIINSLYSPVGAMNPSMRYTDGSGGGGTSSPYVQDQSDFSQDMRGTSPLQQYTGLQSQRDAAGAMKQQRIQQAMQILQDTQNGQTTNLPMLAAAGAMLAPTRTGGFAESLGNAFTAAGPPTQAVRAQDLGIASRMGQLGIEDGSVPLDNAQADIGDFWRRMQLAEQAGSSAAVADTRANIAQAGNTTRTNIASDKNTSNENVAGTRADAAVTAAGIRAQAIKDAASLRANAPPAAVKLYDYVTTAGTDADGNPTQPIMTPQQAVTLLDPRKLGNDPGGFARAVAAQEKMLSDTNMMAPKSTQQTPQQIHDAAVSTVQKTYGATPNMRQSTPSVGGSGPSAPPAPTTDSNTAAPAAAAPVSSGSSMRDATTDEVQMAKTAISRGAPKSAVMARFKQNGINPPDLGQ